MPGKRVCMSGDLQPRVDTQFLHDVAHMALHGVGRDVKATGDPLVAQPFRDQADHFLLPTRHVRAVGGSIATTSADTGPCDLGEERAGHLGWEDLGSIRHRSDGPHQVVERGVLYDEARHARSDPIHEIVLGSSEIHGDHLGSWEHRPGLLGDAQAIAVGTVDIEQDHLRLNVA
jgi:hypothetical protein